MKQEYRKVGTESVTLPRGKYIFECWGASGGDGGGDSARASGGKGGYAIGYIKLRKKSQFYINVGEKGYCTGKNEIQKGGFNGGGQGGTANSRSNHPFAGGGGVVQVIYAIMEMNLMIELLLLEGVDLAMNMADLEAG